MSIRELVIFGAGGDLTRRYLLPALVELHAADYLTGALSVLATDRKPLSADEYRGRIQTALEEHAGSLPLASRTAILERLDYCQADIAVEEEVCRALQKKRAPVVAYLALPPGIVSRAVESLRRADLAPGSRVVIEKPFGESLASARELNRKLAEGFPAEAPFRVDHFLAKGTVQNILGIRFANRIFEKLWSADHIARVTVQWYETLALERRASYYDRAGAVKDMIQNHLLQILALLAMESPVTLEAEDLQGRKLDALRCVRELSPDEAAAIAVRGRYTAGSVRGQPVPDYVAEPGVRPERGTETFAQLILLLDHPRWSGVPFVLQTGKALGEDRREARVVFKRIPCVPFPGPMPHANELRIGLGPDDMGLVLNTTGHARELSLETTVLDATLPPQPLSAYARVLAGLFEGDSTLSISAREAEESWRIVEPVLTAFRRGMVPLSEYRAGSSGPPGRSAHLDP